jgi:two-component system, chemotaxis family, sensor kinase Cph1
MVSNLTHIALGSFFRSTSLGISLIDEKGFIVEVNQGYCAMLGYSSEELIGKHISTFFNPFFKNQLIRFHEQLIHTGVTSNTQLSALRKNGQHIRLHIESMLHVDEAGSKYRLSIVRDVTLEQRFTTLVESINETVFTLDRDECHTGIYGSVLRDYGHTEDIYIGKTIAEIMGDEEAAIHSAANKRALSGEYVRYDWSISQGDETAWFQTSLAPLFSDDGEVYGIVGIARNQTELKQSADDYLRLFNAAPLPQLICRLSDLHIVAVNTSAVDHYGHTQSEFLDKTVLDMLIAKDVPKLEKKIATLHVDDRVLRLGTYTHIKKDGTKIRVEISVHNVLFNGDECMVMVMNDITQMEKSITELKLQYKKVDDINRKLHQHRMALDQTANVILTDRSGVILEVNAHSCALSGYSRDELVGQHSRINKSGKHDEAYYHDMWSTISSGNIWRGDILNRRKDGSLYWVDTTIVPLTDTEGKPQQYLAVRFDITSRKEHEERLLHLNEELNQRTNALTRSNAELEQFAYVVSHDLQEPVRMISSFMELLAAKYGDELDDRAHKYISFAVSGAKQMRKIIVDLLEYAQVDNRFTTLEPVDVADVFQNVLLQNRSKIIEKGADVTAVNLPILTAFRYPLELVLNHLVENALKYHSNDRRVQLRVSAQELSDHWVISVWDNGHGISSEYFEKIFTIFQRLHRGAEYPGTGVGLAIVKKLVVGWGGTIQVDSEVDTWTEFAFTVPKVVG